MWARKKKSFYRRGPRLPCGSQGLRRVLRCFALSRSQRTAERILFPFFSAVLCEKLRSHCFFHFILLCGSLRKNSAFSAVKKDLVLFLNLCNNTILLCGSLRKNSAFSAVKKKLKNYSNLSRSRIKKDYILFTNLFKPSVNLKTLKFISNPSLQPEILR